MSSMTPRKATPKEDTAETKHVAPSRKRTTSEKKRKDRLIQTRVPRDLESTLKAEAERRRLSVSHLIRNVLEDTFELVDGVVADMDQIVTGSVSLARNMSRNARKLASAGQGLDRGEEHRREVEPSPPDTSEGDAADPLEHVYAWNEVVLHKPMRCSSCGRDIDRGDTGYAGLTDEPALPRAWLCASCVQKL
jgi:hypothetical protein